MRGNENLPNPHAGVSEIIGLLEAINDFSGSVDASVLADDFDLEIDEIYPAIESAELLGLISTPEGDVKLTGVGTRFLRADIQLRKDILREQMLKVESISNLLNKLRKSEGRRMKKEDVVEYLSSSMRSLHPDSLFNVLLNWARYAELLRYDADEQEIYLVE
ncbi:MAG: AAA-associated domain-containing protein [Thermoplasmata archaeon]|nr:AAA-associated domain-containing protein [Candidatus Sysuiplasma acidicola]MBX8645794.1 AAA-associated domain-containing protein [Candidatus Sysuiplasma acidicola]MDH2905863.1 AAA-associated domain-containing protein [Methanomassiliicoccales archaeon]